MRWHKDTIHVIEVPKKVCLPRVKSVYEPPTCYDDVDEDQFLVQRYGKTLLRVKDWKGGERNDIILYDDKLHSDELKQLRIEETESDAWKDLIQSIVKTFWDIFVAEGIRRPMLGVEFSIDTGNHTPVCCKKPNYGANESKVIMETIETLLANNFIEESREGGWGSPIVLAPKPHQEHVTEIENFIWRMCVSYRGLNKVTNPFEYPIGRCDAAIEDVGDGHGRVYFISLDAAQGYHQIKVRDKDKPKLAFFGPDDKKYTYKVMPFGPRNAPTCYTAMTRTIQDEATKLFRMLCSGADIDAILTASGQPESIVTKLPRTANYEESCNEMALPILEKDEKYARTISQEQHLKSDKILVPIDGGCNTIRQKMKNSSDVHVTGSAVIIDDLLLWGTSKSLLFLLFECYCRIYLKYRTTLKLKKCDFLKKRFEFVGHDILQNGNTTASSKYDRIKDWKLPTTADSLHSFVSLCNFYNKFLPYFELKVAPLRAMYLKFSHKSIPANAWTDDLKQLFESLKADLTSEPLLARYDSTKPLFLKTDWSSLGLSFILMQPSNDEASKAATDLLLRSGECTFDVTMDGPRLQPIASGMRACRGTEEHYHSFVGESAALRWAIAKNKRYLWGTRFYCMCDMKTLYKILEYDGPIHCLRRWTQELQAYDFIPIHRPAMMMKDVDALNRGPYARIITTYYAISASIRCMDQEVNGLAYGEDQFETLISKRKYSNRTSQNEGSRQEQLEKASSTIRRIYDHIRARKSVKSIMHILPHAPLHKIKDTDATIVAQPFRTYPQSAMNVVCMHSNARVLTNEDVHREGSLCHASASKDLIETFREDHNQRIVRVQVQHVALRSISWTFANNLCNNSTKKEKCTSTAADKYISDNMIHWISINPGIGTLTRHLISTIGERLCLTILNTNETWMTCSETLFPEAKHIKTDTSSLPGRIRSHDDAIHNTIQGIDIHIDERIEFTPPEFAIPSQLQNAIAILTALSQYRGLKLSVITAPTNIEPKVNICLITQTIAKKLPPSWNISCTILKSSDYGDPIMIRKIVIYCSMDAQLLKDHMSEQSNMASGTDARIIDVFPNMQGLLQIELPNDHSQLQAEVLNPHTSIVGSRKGNISAYGLNLIHPMNRAIDVSSWTIGILSTSSDAGRSVQYRVIEPKDYVRLFSHGAHDPYVRDLVYVTQQIPPRSVRRTAIPWRTAETIMEKLFSLGLQDELEERDASSTGLMRCHTLLTALPTKDDWKDAYASDVDTNYIISRLLKDTTAWDEHSEIRRVHKGYWQHLRDNRLQFEKDRLVLFYLIGSTHKYLSLIVVPTSLRHKVFHAYHGTGTGAHMGPMKTLLAIRMRFFWPRMRKDIMGWTRGCEYCIRSRTRRKESTGLVHSWPITTPFAIISVDIWRPGDIRSSDGYRYLFNAMCDMTQFVITVPTKRIDATEMAKLFMEGVLLKFGLCIMVVCDEGSEFRGEFESMCKILNIRFHTVAKRNHKAVGVERYHKFLNHAQRISTEQRKTSAAFVEIGMTTAYAWNASCIDGTDIVRSLPAIGRALRFPVEINESAIPQLTSNVGERVAQYLRYLGSDVDFSRKLLAWIVDDRREQHRERVNEQRNLVKYKPGDIVMGRVAVQSKASRGVVGKLVYQSRGPFIVIEDAGRSTYKVRKYGKPNSPLSKFMAEDLYLLPPQILPGEYIDTTDMRYMNFEFAPQNHPFTKTFDVEGYNTAWYDDIPPSRPPELLDDSLMPDIDEATATPLSATTDETHINEENPEEDNTEIDIAPGGTNVGENNLHQAIEKSEDKLLFIQYTPANTLRPRWYLVQVVLEQSDNAVTDGMYFCTFFQKHTKDTQKPDNAARWWPEWRELEWNEDGTYEYGQRVLFQPRTKPDLQQYAKFGTDVNLTEPSRAILGPFDFEAMRNKIPSKSIVPAAAWTELSNRCRDLNLTPPVLSSTKRRAMALRSDFISTFSITAAYETEGLRRDSLNFTLAILKH